MLLASNENANISDDLALLARAPPRTDPPWFEGEHVVGHEARERFGGLGALEPHTSAVSFGRPRTARDRSALYSSATFPYVSTTTRPANVPVRRRADRSGYAVRHGQEYRMWVRGAWRPMTCA